jgi:DNA-binding PadR family transcriptional regulator
MSLDDTCATAHAAHVSSTPGLREPTYFVLASLLDGPLHGYAILRRAEELSQGTVRLSTGTLYGALERLTAAGLVDPGQEEVVEGRVRRAYTLTDEGRVLLAAESARLEAAARVVATRLGTKKPRLA